ncbi:MAG TPA: HAD family hydrolase [Thermoleophilia bacterium]|nr:HAD family hydrolase [Thermoleophilia bacterium]HQG04207.1 HAD family hydrolase [Thermoleophilia bacterium]HQJ98597.1 HAD family hydrolase [Thermoleophilia bacterium]
MTQGQGPVASLPTPPGKDAELPPLVLFDYDGVLADSFAVLSEAFLAASRKEGLAALRTPDDVKSLFEDNVYASLRRSGGTAAQVRRVLARVSAAAVREAPTIAPFPGMPEAVTVLSEKWHIVIVTSNSEAVVAEWLRQHRVDGVSEVAGSETATSKVEKIRRLVAAHPGQQRPWFVGDTVGDMREACEAGATPLGVAWGWHEPERLLVAGAERIARTPAEIVTIVSG